jgi:hypothetical protein
MKCAQFEEILHDLDRPGTPGLAQREAALAHAESCSSCGRLLTEAEALDFRLHTLAMQDLHRSAPVRVEAILLGEFREHYAAPRRQAKHWYAAVIGVAAVALLALGLVRVRIGLAPVQPTSGSMTAEREGATLPGETTSTSANQNGELNEFVNSDEGTGFVALPYADDTGSLDGGAVIRVAVPRSALASWGLPVSGVAGADRMPAELVVSADGTPQAIRLILETND